MTIIILVAKWKDDFHYFEPVKLMCKDSCDAVNLQEYTYIRLWQIIKGLSYLPLALII